MATDIAFAVAVLVVVGRSLPLALRTFLLTLAIVDDLVAIIVIAVFYSAGLAWAPLLGTVALLAMFGWLQSGRGPARLLWSGPVPAWVILVPLAVVIWAVFAELSYGGNEQVLDHAKGGILIASATAAILGSIVLLLRGAHHRRRQAAR